MKKPFLFLSLFMATLASYGQVTSLNENMNSTCPTASNGPIGWLTYNPVSTSSPEGKWICDLPGGRGGTPGVSCSGLFGIPLSYQLDTSILVSPPMNLSSYTNIYINFDTKTTNFNLGAKLELLVSGDSTIGVDTAAIDTFTVYNKTTSMLPLFGMGDETDWVTHQVDLTAYKGIVPLYFGFRYTSAAGTTGSLWSLDNINTTTVLLPTSVKNRSSDLPLLSVSGHAGTGELRLFCATQIQGNYDVELYDMSGRMVLQQELALQAGTSTQVIPGLALTPGTYVLKMGNELSFTTARIIVW